MTYISTQEFVLNCLCVRTDYVDGSRWRNERLRNISRIDDINARESNDSWWYVRECYAKCCTVYYCKHDTLCRINQTGWFTIEFECQRRLFLSLDAHKIILIDWKKYISCTWMPSRLLFKLSLKIIDSL